MLRWLLFCFFVPFTAVALTFVGTSNRSGELEPCGCQVNQIGGLSRMAEWLSAQRKKDETLFLDAGDTFFSSGLLPASRREMEKMRASVIADAYKEMGLTAITPGERDLAFGFSFLKELAARANTKLVISNLKNEEEGVEKQLVVATKEGKVGILGLVSDEGFGELENPEEAFEKQFKKLRNEVKQVVLLSHLGLEEDRKWIQKYSDLIVIGSHSLDPIAETHPTTKSVVVQPSHEGQTLVTIQGQKGKVVELPKEWDKENTVSKLIRHYHEARGLNKTLTENAKFQSTAKRPFVANPQLCRDCHEEQYHFWENTKHSSAILVLYSKKQHNDADCIRCHSLGFQEAGGFKTPTAAIRSPKAEVKTESFLAKVFEGDKEGSLDSRLQPDRHAKLHKRYHESLTELLNANKITKVYWGTQCEHCHGSRHGHPSSKVATQKKVSAQSCVQCHRPPNAPEFDIGTIQKVACPLMKKG